MQVRVRLVSEEVADAAFNEMMVIASVHREIQMVIVVDSLPELEHQAGGKVND